MPGDCFGIVNEERLCWPVQESIADGYSDGELQRLVFEVWWPHDGCQLIFFGKLAILFEPLMEVKYFSGFWSKSEIVKGSEGKGIELVDD